MSTFYEIIGCLAGICTATSFIPQAWKTFRTKDVKGLSLGMYSIFNIGMTSWVVYGFYVNSFQMIIFNIICLCFSIPVWLMILRYGKKLKK